MIQYIVLSLIIVDFFVLIEIDSNKKNIYLSIAYIC
jgi:hypothetical protein